MWGSGNNKNPTPKVLLYIECIMHFALKIF